jgi:hypothetical protein
MLLAMLHNCACCLFDITSAILLSLCTLHYKSLLINSQCTVDKSNVALYFFKWIYHIPFLTTRGRINAITVINALSGANISKDTFLLLRMFECLITTSQRSKIITTCVFIGVYWRHQHK